MEPLEDKQSNDQDEWQRAKTLRPLIGRQAEFKLQNEGKPVRKRDEDRVRKEDAQRAPAQNPWEGGHRG